MAAKVVAEHLKATAVVVERSDNRKLGPPGKVSSTYVGLESCPDSCPFKAKDPITGKSPCYGQHGKCGEFVLPRFLADAKADQTALEEAHQIRTKLTGKRPLRLHTLGNCATPARAEAVSAAADEYCAKHGQPVWTYTHAHHVPRQSWGGVSVLRSCHTPEQVQQAYRDGYAASIVVPIGTKNMTPMPGGFKVIMCPAQRSKTTTCVTCPGGKEGHALCMHDELLRQKKLVVGFEAHSAGGPGAYHHAWIPSKTPAGYLAAAPWVEDQWYKTLRRKQNITPWDLVRAELLRRGEIPEAGPSGGGKRRQAVGCGGPGGKRRQAARSTGGLRRLVADINRLVRR
jgi:hypothetical protein